MLALALQEIWCYLICHICLKDEAFLKLFRVPLSFHFNGLQHINSQGQKNKYLQGRRRRGDWGGFNQLQPTKLPWLKTRDVRLGTSQAEPY